MNLKSANNLSSNATSLNFILTKSCHFGGLILKLFLNKSAKLIGTMDK